MTPEQAEAQDKPVALLRPQHDLPGDQTAEDHAVIQDATAAALLRLLPVRGIVELLRSLPARERATILARAVSEGAMTPGSADQVLFALAFDGNR